jgi:hypothetical protein
MTRLRVQSQNADWSGHNSLRNLGSSGGVPWLLRRRAKLSGRPLQSLTTHPITGMLERVRSVCLYDATVLPFREASGAIH